MGTVGESIRIMLVDDENLVRAGLRMILESDPRIDVVGECADGRSAVSMVAELSPDLVLMDIRMPVMDGLAASEAILRASPEQKILVLTTFNTDDMVLSALRMGASGFLLKDTPPAELMEAINQVAAGRTMLSESVTRQLIAVAGSRPESTRRNAALERLAVLTEREREIAAAMARGSSNQEIAEELFISLATVKTHIGRVLDKLDADNRVQVALCVFESEDR
ncbi:response regulator [Paeniglutamicibacter sulfureus]|uniref:DNA-binding NarL/FixJ family response regulator n=1 Tax=Paeniglutamicibacter sulfureus TaxID=43666 RepID=A0ABU2BIN4_9MICC|nr:response regulator transcription factor [Paeniglutamicibacter sulfureus]MDO2934311.1 response regulator transcription factor [Paeniglutamicibacter sulfureus]MDR7358502.1 DNA-binding NarL/FixJ family response regulator [Paeniglutamicibacter sulfureus]